MNAWDSGGENARAWRRAQGKLDTFEPTFLLLDSALRHACGVEGKCDSGCVGGSVSRKSQVEGADSALGMRGTSPRHVQSLARAAWRVALLSSSSNGSSLDTASHLIDSRRQQQHRQAHVSVTQRYLGGFRKPTFRALRFQRAAVHCWLLPAPLRLGLLQPVRSEYVSRNGHACRHALTAVQTIL